MKHTRLVLVIACALFAGQLSALAQSIVPADGQNPDQVEQLGYPTQYALVGPFSGDDANTIRPFTVGWYGRQTDAQNPQDFAANPNGNVFNYGIPGQFQIKAVITYGTVSRPGDVAPPDQTLTRDITIPPPTFSELIGPGPPVPWVPAGSTAPPPPDAQPTGANEQGGIPGQWEYFVLKSKDKIIGSALGRVGAQEMFTLWYNTGQRQPDQEGIWRPNNPAATDARNQGSDSSFGLTQVQNKGLAIADFKCVKAPESSPGVPASNYNGNVVFYRQQVRFYWYDNSGARVDGSVLVTKDWKLDGNGDGTWTAIVSDPPPTP